MSLITNIEADIKTEEHLNNDAFFATRVDKLLEKIHSTKATQDLYKKAYKVASPGIEEGDWKIVFQKDTPFEASCSMGSRTITIRDDVTEESEIGFAVFELINATRRAEFIEIEKQAKAHKFPNADAYAKAVETCEHATVIEYIALMKKALYENVGALKKDPTWVKAAERFKGTCLNPEFAWHAMKTSAHTESYRDRFRKFYAK